MVAEPTCGECEWWEGYCHAGIKRVSRQSMHPDDPACAPVVALMEARGEIEMARAHVAGQDERIDELDDLCRETGLVLVDARADLASETQRANRWRKQTEGYAEKVRRLEVVLDQCRRERDEALAACEAANVAALVRQRCPHDQVGDMDGRRGCIPFEQHDRALDRIAELEKLAYLGEHHFPDATYKHRLDECVGQLRTTEARIAELEKELGSMLKEQITQRKRAEEAEADLHEVSILSEVRGAGCQCADDEACAFLRRAKESEAERDGLAEELNTMRIRVDRLVSVAAERDTLREEVALLNTVETSFEAHMLEDYKRVKAHRDRLSEYVAGIPCEQGRRVPIMSGAYPSDCPCPPCHERARIGKGEG